MVILKYLTEMQIMKRLQTNFKFFHQNKLILPFLIFIDLKDIGDKHCGTLDKATSYSAGIICDHQIQSQMLYLLLTSCEYARKAAKDDQVLRPARLCRRSRRGSEVLASDWPSLDSCGHWRVNQRMEDHSVFLSLTLSLCLSPSILLFSVFL